MANINNSPLDPNQMLSVEVAENMKLLTELRQGKPNAEDIESYIRSMRQMLGEPEAFATLRRIRWPKGVVCPRCGSQNIERRDQPSTDYATEFRRHYECLDCIKGLGNSVFDDVTGLPMDALETIQKWAICWHVLSICPPNQAALLLGIPVNYLLQVAVITHDLALLPLEERLAAVQTMTFRRNSEKKTSEIGKKNKEEEIVRAERSIFHSPRHKSRK